MLLDLEDRFGNDSDATSTVAGSSSGAQTTNLDSRPPESLLPFDNVSVSRESSESSFTGSYKNKSDRKPRRRRTSGNQQQHTASTINYHGINIYHAAAQGSLPLCVLLWGMASAKRVRLMAPDLHGNNPMHHAVFADTAEVLGFFMQQCRGQFTDEVKLVDSRNHAGETPLLRAMATGTNVVVKALIDESSDLLVTDYQGNSVFTALAKSGHLWCLNFVYETICHKYGAQVAFELMSSVDNEFHSPLDWAADSGDINVIEFFLRKGISPMRCDSNDRSPLYWAVKAGRVAAARYLALCGCDPDRLDSKGQSPRTLAKLQGDSELLSALHCYRPNTSLPHYTVAEDDGNEVQTFDASKTPKPYRVDLFGLKHSHAIYNHISPSVLISLLYGLLVLLVWILAVIVPFYAWFVLVAAGAYIYRKSHQKAKDARRNVNNSLKKKSILQDILLAHEKGLGFWIGSVIVLVMYLACSYFESFTEHRESTEGAHTDSLGGSSIYNPTSMGGLSGAREDRELFFIVCFFLLLSIVFWFKLVWFDRNPGIVDTRETDYQEILALSLLTNGAPPAQRYCRTTLVRKPLRSKFCARTGCVVARMDHYCVWLNSTIGHGNHRSFIIFLTSHLLLAITAAILIGRALNREIGSEDACSVLIWGVLDERYFFTCMLFLFVCLLTLGLGALAIEQFGNMAFNITTNERINRIRYPWMVDAAGRPCNKFHRGIVANILQFWRVPGYRVDYMKAFRVPGDDNDTEDGTDNQDNQDNQDRSSLTQDNIMRLASPGRGSLTATNSGSSTGGTGAGGTGGAGGGIANFTVRKNSLNHRHIGSGTNNADANQETIPAAVDTVAAAPIGGMWLGRGPDPEPNRNSVSENLSSVDNSNPPHHVPPHADNATGALFLGSSNINNSSSNSNTHPSSYSAKGGNSNSNSNSSGDNKAVNMLVHLGASGASRIPSGAPISAGTITGGMEMTRVKQRSDSVDSNSELGDLMV